jgi:hypothetical protein
MITEMIGSEISSDIENTFFGILRHLEKTPMGVFKRTLIDLGRYSRIIRGSLVKREKIPTENTLLKVGFEDALPIYQKILNLFDEYEDAKKVFWNLNNEKKLFIVYKLWDPGIMTTQQLADFAGTKQNNVTGVIDSLVKADIIERKTLGIYGIGSNGNLAMDLFTLLVVMWRKHIDQLYGKQAHLIASRVTQFLKITDSLIDALDQATKKKFRDSEPIVVKYGRGIFFLELAQLNATFCVARDAFLDSTKISLKPLRRDIKSLLRKGIRIPSGSIVADAYKKVSNYGSTLFLEESGNLYYLTPDCFI